MSAPTERTFRIVALMAIGMSLAPLAVVLVFGEQSGNQLLAELAKHGYTEIRMLDSSGTQIELRSNGTIPIMEDTLGELVTANGFNLVEFSPAPPIQEDSIIVIELNTLGVTY